MIAIGPLLERTRQERNKWLGAAVEIEEHPTRVRCLHDGRNERQFPFYVAKWRANGMRHAVLMEPVLKCRQGRIHRTILGTITDPDRWSVDADAMWQQLRRHVQSTLGAPSQVTPK